MAGLEVFANLDLQVQDQDQDETSLLKSLRQYDFHAVLRSSLAKQILSPEETNSQTIESWAKHVRAQGSKLAASHPATVLIIGYAALQAFLQANVTGPPLNWSPRSACLPSNLYGSERDWTTSRAFLVQALASDGQTAYPLMNHPELMYLAQILLNQDFRTQLETTSRWARLRVNRWHQRLLLESSPSLKRGIEEDLAHLSVAVSKDSALSQSIRSTLMLEITTMLLMDGRTAEATSLLDQATTLRGFEYTLTGQMGKRTKFQEKATSQLVVLARSRPTAPSEGNQEALNSHTDNTGPKTVSLDDDTLLEKVEFRENEEDLKARTSSTALTDTKPLPLDSLDPSHQPRLHPLDAIILLDRASYIAATAPEDGITREELLPYVSRVLDDQDVDWQIHTQALLVRCRIESHHTRTIERSVLQLQALVDQITLDTTAIRDQDRSQAVLNNGVVQNQTQTPDFSASSAKLPASDALQSVQQRMRYLHLLDAPYRWTLESELAQRWVSVGGLRAALEVYERLEMWAEAALCWAATDREDKARDLLRSQLFDSPASANGVAPERVPLPADAVRLYCILGDLEQDAKHYERAWDLSQHRSARAARSLAKSHFKAGRLDEADAFFSHLLRLTPQDATVWFTLGCVRIQMRHWSAAADAFRRAVQIEPDDAESWSNLAVSLLRLASTPDSGTESLGKTATDDDDIETTPADPQKHVREALAAFRRAARLKRDSYRIWQNLLNVAATLSPPPFSDILLAQMRLIELRGSIDGERCIDIEVLEGLLEHIVASDGGAAKPLPSDASHEDLLADRAVRNKAPQAANAIANRTGTQIRETKPGLERLFTELVTQHVQPLITTSRRLWVLVARLAQHQHRPAAALDAYEKAWRATLQQPGWDDAGTTPERVVDGSAATTGNTSDATTQAHHNNVTSNGAETTLKSIIWPAVVKATLDLVEAYERLGPQSREIMETREMLDGQRDSILEENTVEKHEAASQPASQSESELEPVLRNWKFKAKSALRTVIGRREKAGLTDVDVLNARLQSLA